MLSDSKHRIAYGYVHDQGYALWGSGFTARRTGTGTYIITFNPRFKYKPIVMTQIHNAQFFVAVTTIDPTYCAVVTSGTSGGAAGDLPFMFIAIGVERG